MRGPTQSRSRKLIIVKQNIITQHGSQDHKPERVLSCNGWRQESIPSNKQRCPGFRWYKEFFGLQEPIHSSRNLVLRTSRFIASAPQDGNDYSYQNYVLRNFLSSNSRAHTFTAHVELYWSKCTLIGWTREPASATVVFKIPAAVLKRQHKIRNRA